ncbi:unnamed protein product [Ceutorhynchus assimilis]|uniref:Hexamerin n=1 Tax=Ceutorhynchus assimilis TaxID=467358 RepID=A0A9N9QMJ1_9CUCU|nr:unnamed protein product [Ceutorhynchus assimilis]
MKSAVALLVLVAVASASRTVPTTEVQAGNLFQVTQHVQDQFHHAQQLGYNGAQVANFLLKQGYPRTVVNYLVQQYEAGLDQPFLQSSEHLFQQQGVQQQGQGVSYFNVQYSHVQLQRVLQYVQTALKFFVNQQVSNQYVFQQLQQVVQHIQQIQSVQSLTESQVAVVYQILNNLHQFVMQQGEQLPQLFVQQIESAYLAAQQAYQIFNHQESQVVSSLYYQQLLQQIRSIQQYLHAQTVTPQLGFISLQLNQAYQIYFNAQLMSQKAHFMQPLNLIVVRQLNKAYQSLNTAYLLAQQNGLPIVGQLQNALAVAQRLQLNGSSQYNGISQSQVGVSQAHQYGVELVHYVEQQVAQGVLSQVHASYILQQLQQIQYAVSQAQVQQYLQNVHQYVQQQIDISPVVVQHISQQIQLVLQSMTTGQFQGQNYVQTLVQRYFNGPQQYSAVQQRQFNNGVQQGQLNIPRQFNVVEQGQLNTPYQYNGVQTPYQHQWGFNQAQQQQWYTPSQGMLPLAYQHQYMPFQHSTVAY